MSALDAYFGKVFCEGVEIELGGGFDFVDGILAEYNTETERVQISLNLSAADEITYDNATSGLAASTVQDAIDELATWGLPEVLANDAHTGGFDLVVDLNDAINVTGDFVSALEGGATARGTAGMVEVSRSGGGASGYAIKSSGTVSGVFSYNGSVTSIGSMVGETRALATGSEIARWSTTAYTLATAIALAFTTQASIKRGSDTIVETTATDTRIAAVGVDSTVSIRQGAAGATRLGYFTNVSGSPTQAAFYFDGTLGGDRAVLSVSTPAALTAGRGLVVAGGNPGAGAVSGWLALRPGVPNGAGSEDVYIEDSAGLCYLRTDIANTRVRVDRSVLQVGTTGTAGTVGVELTNNTGSGGNAISYDGSIQYFGSGTKRVAHRALASGSGFGFEGHAFYVDAGAVLEVRGLGISLESAKKYDTRGTSWIASVGNTNVASSTTSLWGFAQAISVTTGGAAVAGGGDIRLRRTSDLMVARNEGNTANISLIGVTSADTVALGDGTDSPILSLSASATLVGLIGATTIWTTRATEFELAAGMAWDTASGTATHTIGGTTWLSSTTGLASFAQPISVTSAGGAVASAGLFRTVRTSSAFVLRNQGNTADIIAIGASSGDALSVGDGTNATSLQLAASTTISGLIGATTVWTTRVDQLEIRTSMYLDFEGELDIRRNGTAYITSTAGVVNVTTNAHLNIVKGQALGGGAAATMGTIGGSGPTVAAQNKWVEIKSNGTTGWVPFWV